MEPAEKKIYNDEFFKGNEFSCSINLDFYLK